MIAACSSSKVGMPGFTNGAKVSRITLFGRRIKCSRERSCAASMVMSAFEGITDVWWIHPRGNVAVFAQFISAHYSILISQFYCLLVDQS
jgi:hypothetical protein